MKKRYTLLQKNGSLIRRVLVLISVLFIWILIDAGNVYGQSETKNTQVEKHLNGSYSGSTDAFLRVGEKQTDPRSLPTEDDDFEIRPNPSSGDPVFDFEFTIRTSETNVGVIDAMGRMVFQTILTPDQTIVPYKLNMSDQKPGTYVVIVKHGGQIHTKRFLKL